MSKIKPSRHYYPDKISKVWSSILGIERSVFDCERAVSVCDEGSRRSLVLKIKGPTEFQFDGSAMLLNLFSRILEQIEVMARDLCFANIQRIEFFLSPHDASATRSIQCVNYSLARKFLKLLCTCYPKPLASSVAIFVVGKCSADYSESLYCFYRSVVLNKCCISSVETNVVMPDSAKVRIIDAVHSNPKFLKFDFAESSVMTFEQYCKNGGTLTRSQLHSMLESQKVTFGFLC